MRTLLALHLAATLFMTGLIWFVQVVHYPLFEAVGERNFPGYERLHTERTTWVVAPVMLVELAAAGWLLLRRPEGVPGWAPVAGGVLLGVIWLSTFVLQVPRHAELASGFASPAHSALVATNWIRTWAWTARAVLALCWMNGRAG